MVMTRQNYKKDCIILSTLEELVPSLIAINGELKHNIPILLTLILI